MLQHVSCAFAFLGTHGDSSDRPQTPDQALRLPDWPQYDAAMRGELASTDKKDSYTLTDLPPGANTMLSALGGFFPRNLMLMGVSLSTKPGLLLRVIPRRMVPTSKLCMLPSSTPPALGC